MTVIIVTWKLLSVGERQLPFLYDRNVGIIDDAKQLLCWMLFFIMNRLAFFSRGVIYILSGINYENTA